MVNFTFYQKGVTSAKDIRYLSSEYLLVYTNLDKNSINRKKSIIFWQFYWTNFFNNKAVLS